MSRDVDDRVSAILAECLPIRAASRMIAVSALAWSHSAACRWLSTTGNPMRFWSIVMATAIVVVMAGTVMGVAR